MCVLLLEFSLLNLGCSLFFQVRLEFKPPGGEGGRERHRDT